MWLTCDQAVLLRQLPRSPRKKNAQSQVTREISLGNTNFFFYVVHFVYFIWRNSSQSRSYRWTNMRLFPPFIPKSESKVLPRLAIEGRIVAFSLDTKVVLSFTWSQSLTSSFTTQYLLCDLLHNSLQVTKFSLLICRLVYIAWCSLPSSIVGWSGVPTRSRTIWIFKVKCSRVTFLPADCRNVAFFTTHTSLVFRYLL